MNLRHVSPIPALLFLSACLAPVGPGDGSDKVDDHAFVAEGEGMGDQGLTVAEEAGDNTGLSGTTDCGAAEDRTLHLAFTEVGQAWTLPWPGYAGALAMKRSLTVEGPEGYVLVPVEMTAVVGEQLVWLGEPSEELPVGALSTGTTHEKMSFECDATDPEEMLMLVPQRALDGSLASIPVGAVPEAVVTLTLAFDVDRCDGAVVAEGAEVEGPSALCEAVWDGAPEVAVVGECEAPPRPEVTPALDVELIAAGAHEFRLNCSGCHDLDRTKAGPPLRGIVGGRAGRRSYPYSPALRNAWMGGFIWTPEALDGWLSDTSDFSRENFDATARMYFRMDSPEDRAAVIAYLQNPEAAE